MSDADQKHLDMLGARLLAVANDIKRTISSIADDLSIPLPDVEAVVAGNADLKAAQRILYAVSERYPVALGDLWLEPDDTDGGVVITRGAKGRSTARVYERPRADGQAAPYYEYRDTAMSRTAPFRPEWIQPLRIVGNDDPENSAVVYNNGHILHQLTFFIGEVNFYWKIGDKSYCREMNTGDSNYITPFIPHSFTSRKASARGLIVAVTYASSMQAALPELERMGQEMVLDLAGDLRNQDQFSIKLKRHLSNEAMSSEALREALVASGYSHSRADMLSLGAEPTNINEIDAIAEVLGVRRSDLTTASLRADEAVVIQGVDESQTRNYRDTNHPAYRLRPLARTRHQPELKAFDTTVLSDSIIDGAVLQHGLHEYVFNYGDEPIKLRWNEGSHAVLDQWDSAYVRPTTSHSFSVQNSSRPGRLLKVRIPGNVDNSVLDELAAFAPVGRHRVFGEDQQWF